jgi:hypothetical protein
MALDERSRHQLFVRLEDVLGPEAASTLMEHLPPTGWADVATKQDMDALRMDLGAFRSATMRDLDALRSATKHDLDSLRTDLDALREVMSARFEAVDYRFEALEGRLLAEIRAMGSQTFRANIALLVAVIGLVFATARIH